MMVPAAVARRFVPQLHSPHIERARYDKKKNKTKRKDRKKPQRWGLRELNTATARHRSNLQTLKSTYEN